jgi:hypothetical protein
MGAYFFLSAPQLLCGSGVTLQMNTNLVSVVPRKGHNCDNTSVIAARVTVAQPRWPSLRPGTRVPPEDNEFILEEANKTGTLQWK